LTTAAEPALALFRLHVNHYNHCTAASRPILLPLSTLTVTVVKFVGEHVGVNRAVVRPIGLSSTGAQTALSPSSRTCHREGQIGTATVLTRSIVGSRCIINRSQR